MIDIENVKLDLRMCDSMKVAGCHVLSRETYNEVHESLNELDRLRVFKKTFDEYELAQKQGFIAYENWKECEKELETMKTKVNRYFELKEILYDFSGLKSHKQCDLDEYRKLEKELKEWSEKHV